MKLKFPLVAAFVAILSLTACGGGGGSGSSDTVAVSNPTAFSVNDTVNGTGTQAINYGETETVNYTVWLYSETAADKKGKQVDTGTGFSFVLGGNSVIAGLEKGVTGMKTGGKRTIIVPASLGYGAAGYGSVPANSGLVFEVELTKVALPASGPTAFVKTDTLLGTGTEAATGKSATVTYTGWVYSATAPGNKGAQFDTGSITFVLGNRQVIPGFDLGVTGMKVGGKRTVVIPYTLGYGSTANGSIPANSGLVFDIQLTTVQ
jgi:FKBP-type peptidyl-prolyl cis-trans isomerase